MDVNRLEAAITPRTRAIMPCICRLARGLRSALSIGRQHQLRVIEDAAHAIGTEYKGKRIGSFGDTQVFSFIPTKT